MIRTTPTQLARFLHNTYELLSERYGWQTQLSTKVRFSELPKANKKVMLAVARTILSEIRRGNIK